MNENIIEITINDAIFPDHLKQIKNPPRKLYCIGNVELLTYQGVAVVGTRRCSPYGRWAAYEIGKQIADCGVTVISGMAEGVDSEGHRGCLDAEGNTIAVMGTGIDICFPRSNKKLYERIANKGLVISEYGPGDNTGPWAFPERNRIISGLAKSVVVVEGTKKSGSMITANLALEQSREVFAVPGNINQPNAAGVNLLIRDGAIPITSIEEVPEILQIGESKTFKRKLEKCSNDEKKILRYIKENPGSNIETIAFKMNMEMSETSAITISLELKGYIKKIYDDLYVL